MLARLRRGRRALAHARRAADDLLGAAARVPLSLPLALAFRPSGDVGTDAWLGFAYVSLFSMFLGFFAWYAGLSAGGVAKAGQTQLLQTPLTLALSALVLGEHVPPAAIVCTVAVLLSIVGTQRARVERQAPSQAACCLAGG